MTALVRKYWPFILAAFVCAGVMILWFKALGPQLEFGQKSYNYQVADTQAERAEGLSGRKHLPADQALLFKFDKIGRHCMWMKDMHFAIDIVWLSPEKYVKHIEENVTPETYPKNFCSPGDDAVYVVEVAAGQVKNSGVKVGDRVRFCLRSCYN